MSKRNRFLSDPKLQWALIRRVMMHWSLTVLALLSIGVLVQLLYAPSEQTFLGAISHSFGQQTPLLIVMFMLVPVYMRDIVKFSHRFAGPMSRLRAILNDLAGGRRGMSLKFRPGDFWQETATDFNRFYEKHIELLDRVEELELELARVKKSSQSAKKIEVPV